MFRTAIIALLFISSFSFSFAYQIIIPKTVEQGAPLHIFILGEDSSRIVQIEFNKEKVWPFILEEKPHAIFGISLDAKPGIRNIYFTDIKSSSTIIKSFAVVARKKPHVAFSIPSKLGGNTKAGEKEVATSINEENTILSHLTSSPLRLWKNRFVYPLSKNTVTDTYGYSRVTGGTIIVHKGTDFKAPIGTPVFAMNDGVVLLSKQFTIYGNTVVIDHGGGILTLYMHLSKITAKEGEPIKEGELVGYSGQTGYANGPHLHISVKISGQSVDPLLFMRYVGTR